MNTEKDEPRTFDLMRDVAPDGISIPTGLYRTDVDRYIDSLERQLKEEADEQSTA